MISLPASLGNESGADRSANAAIHLLGAMEN